MRTAAGRKGFLMKRREWLAAGTAALGAFWAGGISAASGEKTNAFVWTYEPLDPDVTAARAYQLYPDGSCMYASFRAIVESVGLVRSEKHPEERPFWESFPYGMMFYGRGGVHDYGSLCGVLNGCAAAISLLTPDRKAAAAMTRELFDYYESTPLPIFTPAESKFAEMEQSVAESVLCHISVSRWRAESDAEVESPRRKDRCKRLTADGVKKTVEMLNARYHALADGSACPVTQALEPAASCIVCHAPEGSRPDANVRMNCTVCHDDLGDDHGIEVGKK